MTDNIDEPIPEVDPVAELDPVAEQIFYAIPAGDTEVINDLKETLPEEVFMEAYEIAYDTYQLVNEIPEEERIANTAAKVAEENELLVTLEEG